MTYLNSHFHFLTIASIDIQEGLKIMAEGNYGREKLVYTIA